MPFWIGSTIYVELTKNDVRGVFDKYPETFYKIVIYEGILMRLGKLINTNMLFMSDIECNKKYGIHSYPTCSERAQILSFCR